jgi:hypothetical protein
MSGLYHTFTRSAANPVNVAENLFGGPRNPARPPSVPNQNDALNAAQAQTDALRARRGVLSNIFAGAQNSQPAVGRTQLGT